MFEHAEFVTWANEHVVMLVGHPKGSHKSVDVVKPAKGEPNKTCSVYPGIACEEHERVFADATGKGGDSKDTDSKGDKPKAKPKPKKDDDAKPPPKLEVKGFPTTYIINPDGAFEVMRGDREPESCRSVLEEAQKKVDEHPLTLTAWQDVRKLLVTAEKAFKASTWKAAYAAYQKIDTACAGTPPKSLAESLKPRLDAIDAKIAARMADIDKGPGDDAVKTKLRKALRADYPGAMSTPLAALVALDVALGETPAPAAAPAAGDTEPGPAPTPTPTPTK